MLLSASYHKKRVEDDLRNAVIGPSWRWMPTDDTPTKHDQNIISVANYEREQ